MSVDVDNFMAGFFGQIINGDMKTLVLILGLFLILYVIGRQPLIRLFMNIIRGAAYLLMAAIVVYIIKYYPKEMLYHAHRFWTDLNNFFGAG